ncbi:MAG: DUF488 family protein [Enterococcus hirae]|nr:DUF488 family protein [Enterococcus hirae]
MIKLKRVYSAREKGDGFRILVDRIWPRGISKEKVQIDLWLKEIAPSTELRKFFGHLPERFPVFEEKYLEELMTDQEKQLAVKQLAELCQNYPIVTLVYGAKNEQQNQAVVLKALMERKLNR